MVKKDKERTIGRGLEREKGRKTNKDIQGRETEKERQKERDRVEKRERKSVEREREGKRLLI